MEIRFYLITKTIPEYNSKHRNLYTCSIGVSPELGLIRVYPIPIVSDFNSGHIYDMEVEKRKVDTRFRSYELVGGYGSTPSYKKGRKFNYSEIAQYLIGQSSRSISDLNARRDSIGILPIYDFRLYWEYSERYVNNQQRGLFEDVEIPNFTRFTKQGRQKEARIMFRDPDGMHDLQFNEWGVYEYGRKFGSRPDAFRYAVKSSHLLIGNMLQYQTTWMALKGLNLTSDRIIAPADQMQIFDS